MSIRSPYLTTAEAADYLRLKESTLNAMRWRKEGPCWRKHGGCVVYHRDSLDHWSRTRDSDPGNRPKNPIQTPARKVDDEASPTA